MRRRYEYKAMLNSMLAGASQLGTALTVIPTQDFRSLPMYYAHGDGTAPLSVAKPVKPCNCRNCGANTVGKCDYCGTDTGGT